MGRKPSLNPAQLRTDIEEILAYYTDYSIKHISVKGTTFWITIENNRKIYFIVNGVYTGGYVYAIENPPKYAPTYGHFLNEIEILIEKGIEGYAT